MTTVAVGINLAEHGFAVHGVNQADRAALVRPSVARDKMLEMIAAVPPCLIGMEACTNAHHWARLFMGHGHTVRLFAPKFVTPYRLSGKRGKNDAADAQAICEAVQRPQMRFRPGQERSPAGPTDEPLRPEWLCGGKGRISFKDGSLRDPDGIAFAWQRGKTLKFEFRETPPMAERPLHRKVTAWLARQFEPVDAA